MSANHRGNGHRNAKDHKVRVAIVGVGNCASSLVQGVHYYRDASPKDSVPGLMHVNLGGYHIRDIEFVAAFDIDKNKVGLDLADAIFSYLPVGSEEATKWYVEQALTAGVGFVNCIPVFIAREPYWQKRFEEKGLPIIGDDIKSQVGATIVHRVLTRLFRDRGVKLERTYQLNFGGNTDFLNMLERERLMSKKISKTRSVTS